MNSDSRVDALPEVLKHFDDALDKFADSVHVYPVGAEVFSRELAKEFDTLRGLTAPGDAGQGTLP